MKKRGWERGFDDPYLPEILKGDKKAHLMVSRKENLYAVRDYNILDIEKHRRRYAAKDNRGCL